MYGLPKDLDLTLFIDKELIQVVIGQDKTILNFYDNLSINISCDFDISGQKTFYSDISTFPSSSAGLVKLLGQKIVNATKQGKGDLVLTLSNDEVLTLFELEDPYESYVITHNTSTIVV